MEPQDSSQWSRSFELVYYDPSPRFRGRTHFRDPDNDLLTTEQRIAYLQAYAELLRRENNLGKEWLSSEAVSDQEAEQLAAQIKSQPSPQHRQSISLRFWRWKLQGNEKEEWVAPDYDDNLWNELEAPTVLNRGRAMLLRSTAQVKPAERVVLEVEAIHDEYDLWVNGRFASHHQGYEPHAVDITSLVQTEAENTFAIRVSEKPGDQIGLAGVVRVVGTRSTFIEDVFVKPLEAEEGRPTKFQVLTTVRNAGKRAFSGKLAVRFYHWFPVEQEVAAFEMPVMDAEVPSGLAVELVQECIWSGAALWWPERPQLYKVEVVLKGETGEPVDDYLDTVGLRTIQQRGGRLYLNGRRFVLRGFGDHLGFAPAGDSHSSVCPPDVWIVKNFLLAKGANANAVRIHPWGSSGKPGEYGEYGWPAWGLPTDGTNYVRIADIADQMGICLIWVTRHWTLWGHGFREHYREENMEKLLVPSLKRVRNHPSIIAYEGMNEVGLSLAHMVILGQGNSPQPGASQLLPEEVETVRHLHHRRFTDYCAKYIRVVNSVDDSRLVCPDSQWSPGYQHNLGRPTTARQEQESVFTMANNIYWDFHEYPGWYAYFQDMYARKDRFWPDGRARAAILGECGIEAMPDWERYRGLPWRSLWLNNGRPCAEIERVRLGRPLRILRDSEVHLSQAYQGLCIQQTANIMRTSNCDGMNINLIADGLAEGNYHKGVCDLYRRAKLGYFAARMVYQPTLVTGMDGDFVLSEGDALHLTLVNDAAERIGQQVKVRVQVKEMSGNLVGATELVATLDESGTVSMGDYRPQFPRSGLYQIEYIVTGNASERVTPQAERRKDKSNGNSQEEEKKRDG